MPFGLWVLIGLAVGLGPLLLMLFAVGIESERGPHPSGGLYHDEDPRWNQVVKWTPPSHWPKV